MTFIKIGDKYINFDNVTSIQEIHPTWKTPGLQIKFVGPDDSDSRQELWIEDKDGADLLRDWLERKATDLSPATVK